MKISKVIELLARSQSEHGDISVYVVQRIWNPQTNKPVDRHIVGHLQIEKQDARDFVQIVVSDIV